MVVEMEPFGEAEEVFWMLALLLRLEPKPKLLKREFMTSTSREKGAAREEGRGFGREMKNERCRSEGGARVRGCESETE